MKMEIARDARPQVRTLLFAAALSVVLWFIPYAEILTYPFRIFVTFIHEGGHALAALLTGNTVQSLSVNLNASGETYTTQGGLFSQFFIASAGYMGAMTYGALLLMLIRRSIAARFVLIGSAALILMLTITYGLFSPLLHGVLFDPFTLVAGVLLVLGLIFSARYASPRAASFLTSFLAVQCVLNALFDLKTVLFLSTASNAATDAMNMRNATGIPAIFWALLWTSVAFVILSIALRAYAVKSSKPSQPDLPFEDPTDI
ncbi:MAG: M50 family metallopeptidase [Pyrinomonadaceae bacterium]|nr:M50 family metallopeptidase [Pyrinomonadaceae bacterium]